MIYGYAVEKRGVDGVMYHDAYFEAGPGANLRKVRNRALAWAREHRGFVSAVGLLNERETIQELQFIAEDGL